MNENDLFLQVFQHFQGKYKGLKMKGNLVYYNGECRFNTDGHNLLFNLTTLCEILNDELR